MEVNGDSAASVSLPTNGPAEVHSAPLQQPVASTGPSNQDAARARKRTRDSLADHLTAPSATRSAADPPQISAFRRVESVVFSGFEIKPSYASPYPLDDFSTTAAPHAASSSSSARPAVDARQQLKVTLGRSSSRKSELKDADPPTTNGAGPPSRRHSTLAHEAKSITPELAAPVEPSINSHTSTMPFETLDSASAHIVPETPLVSPSEAPAGDASTINMQSHLLDCVVHHMQTDSPLTPMSEVSAEADIHPSRLVDVSLPQPSVSAPSPQTYTTNAPRGHAGRFQRKPPEETVRGRRALAKAAAASGGAPVASTSASNGPHLTQRQQRELKREAKAHAAGQQVPPDTTHAATKRLFVCEGCFKYMLEERALTKHQKECTYKHPPGRRVYHRGAHAIWEVDGAVEKLYCQNLCLFGKLFIEHKYMFFDVEGFTFYVMTDATPSRDWPLAYFSKEKLSYDDYNLACIVTFPPYRQKGWATLLIELSYEITRRNSATPGSPERPLSDMGLRGYLAYWTSIIVRYFREVFEHQGEPPRQHSTAIDDVSEDDDDDEDPATKKKAARRSRGWDGELPLAVGGDHKAGRHSTRVRVNGSSTLAMSTDEAPTRDVGGQFAFRTTLEDVAEACNLRPDDAAFALVESGLAQWRRPVVKKRGGRGGSHDGHGTEGESGEEVLELVVSKELVEEVALRKAVKPRPMLDLAYVALDL